MYDVNNEEEVYVVTYKELLFSLVVFIIILVALFPKGILKDQISADKSNYDLSMVYLKDLLEHNPDDESLQLILLEKSIQMGDINASLTLSQNLLSSENEYIKQKSILLAYETKKAKYFSIKNEKEQKAVYNELEKLFQIIFAKKLYDDNIHKWYEEAALVQNNHAAYYFLQTLLNKDPRNVNLLSDGYYLSMKLYKREDTMKYLNALEKYDTQNALKWAMAKYDILIHYKDYNSAEIILQQYADNSVEMKNRLADFYLMMQKYQAASDVYMKLYFISADTKTKQEYFIKAVETLQSGNLMKHAAKLVHKFENNYIHDRKMRKFFLKVYLAAGELEYASELSKKILLYEN